MLLNYSGSGPGRAATPSAALRESPLCGSGLRNMAPKCCLSELLGRAVSIDPNGLGQQLAGGKFEEDAGDTVGDSDFAGGQI